MHWPEPIITKAIEADAGPVMVTVEYRIGPENREVFLEAMELLSHERNATERMLGTYSRILPAGPVPETFLVESWLEHLRQHKRVTNADRVLEDKVYSKAQGKPIVTHFIAVAWRPSGG